MKIISSVFLLFYTLTIFAQPIAPDLSKIKLQVGARAQVTWEFVNLRSYPQVPNDWDANIVVELVKKDRMTIIDGPECSHDGTWWKVRTDSGYEGWIREILPEYRLIKRID